LIRTRQPCAADKQGAVTIGIGGSIVQWQISRVSLCVGLLYLCCPQNKNKNSNGAGEEDEDTMDIDGVIAFMEELGLEQNDNALVRSSRLAANH
jgi:hypothetical protein